MDAAKNTDWNYISLGIDSSAVLDFSAAGLGKVVLDPAQGTESPNTIEGNFADANTFAGIIRFPLTSLTRTGEEASFIELTPGQEKLTCKLEITNIYAYGVMELFDPIMDLWSFPENGHFLKFQSKWTTPKQLLKILIRQTTTAWE